MTRFMMTLDDAVDAVLYAFEHGKPVTSLCKRLLRRRFKHLRMADGFDGKPSHEVRIIGTRHGEKLYEALLTREEMVAAEDLVATTVCP